MQHPMATAAAREDMSAIQQEQQPLIERRILFHPARKSDSSRCLPAGIEPLNPVTNREIEGKANGKRTWHDMAGQHDDVVLDWGAPAKIGAGLSNLGNTCFLNSVLQCLTYTPPLSNFLGSGKHKATCRNSGFCALCALEGHVKVALRSWGKVVSPNNLVKNLRNISRAFQQYRQEDAHEYLRYLLEALHKASLPKSSNSKSTEEERSLMHKIFGGRLRSQVKCTVCNHCSDTFDPFLDLSLEINQAESLGKALARFTATEILDGVNKYQCTKCQKKVRALKRFTIETAPNILTVQFKRFSSVGHHGRKIDKKVHFGRTLDLKPFMSHPKNPCPYELYGVLVHSGGSTHSGHYFCFVRTAADMWHVLDDSRVTQLSEKTVLDQKAYILFYMRKPTSDATKPSITAAPSAIRPKLPIAAGRIASPVPKFPAKAPVPEPEVSELEIEPAAVSKVPAANNNEAAEKPATKPVEAAANDNAEKHPTEDNSPTPSKMQRNLSHWIETTGSGHEVSANRSTVTDDQVPATPSTEPQVETSVNLEPASEDVNDIGKASADGNDIDTMAEASTEKNETSEPSKVGNEIDRTPEPVPTTSTDEKAAECEPEQVTIPEPESPIRGEATKVEASSPAGNKRRWTQGPGESPSKSLKKVDKNYLKLLRGMPKSRRFLLARAIENAQGENHKRTNTEEKTSKMNGSPKINGSPKMNGSPKTNGGPMMNGTPKINGCPKMNGVRPSENKDAAKDAFMDQSPPARSTFLPGTSSAPSTSSTKFDQVPNTPSTSTTHVPGTSTSTPARPNELFGDGVARWEDVEANGVDAFLKSQHRTPNGRRDEWDEEYDRGKVKKVRRGAAGGRLTADGNPFQVLASAKQTK